MAVDQGPRQVRPKGDRTPATRRVTLDAVAVDTDGPGHHPRTAGEVERAAELIERLHGVSAALGATTSEPEVAEAILDAGMQVLGAVRGMVSLLRDATDLEAVAWRGYPRAIRERWPMIALDADLPLSEAARTGRTIVLPSPDAWRTRYPALANEPSDHRAVAVIPLPGPDGVTFGAMAFSFDGERDFLSEELLFMRVLAQQSGQAMDRARLFEAERRARAAAEENERRLRFLADAGLALSSSLDVEATLNQVARLAVPEIADWCSVTLAERDGTLRGVAIAHIDPSKEPLIEELTERYPTRMDAPHGAAEVIRTGRSMVFPEIPDELLVEMARDDRHLELLRGLGFASGLLVPLILHDRVIGALALIQGPSGRRFTGDDVSFVEQLARRAAQAVQNARLFQERSRIARTLQASLLPPELPMIPGVDLGVVYEAAGEAFDVGGDFYDVLEAGRSQWVLVVGDVCGKGPDAAATTALVRHTLRAAALRTRVPRKVLRMLNQAMVRAGTAFCTLGYVRLRRKEGDAFDATILCGGHPQPILMRADGTAAFVGAHGMLIGSFDDPLLPEQRVTLTRGDVLLLYTDGVIEAHNGYGSFGEERLLELASRHARDDADSIARTIRDEVLAFQVGEQRDDVAVLVAKVI